MPPKINSSMRSKEFRLNSFTDGIKVRGIKEKVYWIDKYNEDIVEPLIECGFYYSPSKKSMSRLTCYFCGKSESYEDNMDLGDLLKMHYSKNIKCHLSMIMVTLYKFEGMLNASKADSFSFWNHNGVSDIRNPHSKSAIKLRSKFFHNFPDNGNSTVNIDTLTKAGFIYLPSYESDDRVSCYYCNCSLEGWEDGDIPLEEHKKNSNRYCYFLDTYKEVDISTLDKVNISKSEDIHNLLSNITDNKKIDEVGSITEKEEESTLLGRKEDEIYDLEKNDLNPEKSEKFEMNKSENIITSKRRHQEPLRRSKRIKNKPLSNNNNGNLLENFDTKFEDSRSLPESDDITEDTSIISKEYNNYDDSFVGSENSQYLDSGREGNTSKPFELNNDNDDKGEFVGEAVELNTIKDNDVEISPNKSTKKRKVINKEFSNSPHRYNISDQNLGDYDDANVNFLESNIIPLKSIKFSPSKIPSELGSNFEQNRNKYQKHISPLKMSIPKLDLRASPIKQGRNERRPFLNTKDIKYNILDTSFEDEKIETFDIKKFLKGKKNSIRQGSDILNTAHKKAEISDIYNVVRDYKEKDNAIANSSKLDIDLNDISGSTDIETVLELKKEDNASKPTTYEGKIPELAGSFSTTFNSMNDDNENNTNPNLVEAITQINQEILKSIESLSMDDIGKSDFAFINSNLPEGLPSSKRKSSTKSVSSIASDLSFKIRHNKEIPVNDDSKHQYSNLEDKNNTSSMYSHSNSRGLLLHNTKEEIKIPSVEVVTSTLNESEYGEPAQRINSSKFQDSGKGLAVKQKKHPLGNSLDKYNDQNIRLHNKKIFEIEYSVEDGWSDIPKEESKSILDEIVEVNKASESGGEEQDAEEQDVEEEEEEEEVGGEEADVVEEEEEEVGGEEADVVEETIEAKIVEEVDYYVERGKLIEKKVVRENEKEVLEEIDGEKEELEDKDEGEKSGKEEGYTYKKMLRSNSDMHLDLGVPNGREGEMLVDKLGENIQIMKGEMSGDIRLLNITLEENSKDHEMRAFSKDLANEISVDKADKQIEKLSKFGAIKMEKRGGSEIMASKDQSSPSKTTAINDAITLDHNVDHNDSTITLFKHSVLKSIEPFNKTEDNVKVDTILEKAIEMHSAGIYSESIKNSYNHIEDELEVVMFTQKTHENLQSPKKFTKLSGDYNSLIEASTPHGYRSTVKNSISLDKIQWEPASLGQFLDNISNFEETTRYLKAISTSKNELHNDYDSELTNFISAMPEEEENMTIHEWVKHCSSNCGKLIKDSFDEMIQFYEREYLRGLDVLRSLPTSD